jgi:hypothetical protein
MHVQPLVNAISWGILTDFQGPNVHGVITVDKYWKVIKAYARIGFLEQTREILCGICKTEPDTTCDIFVGDFCRAYVNGYRKEWDKKCVNGGAEGMLRSTRVRSWQKIKLDHQATSKIKPDSSPCEKLHLSITDTI